MFTYNGLLYITGGTSPPRVAVNGFTQANVRQAISVLRESEFYFKNFSYFQCVLRDQTGLRNIQQFSIYIASHADFKI